MSEQDAGAQAAPETVTGQALKTTELPLAAKLYREGCQLQAFDRRQVRGRRVTEFTFSGVDPQLVDDFRTGADGLTQYETCRKMLMRIIDDDASNTRRDRP
jgi:hypothetical protein